MRKIWNLKGLSSSRSSVDRCFVPLKLLPLENKCFGCLFLLNSRKYGVLLQINMMKNSGKMYHYTTRDKKLF